MAWVGGMGAGTLLRSSLLPTSYPLPHFPPIYYPAHCCGEGKFPEMIEVFLLQVDTGFGYETKN